MANGTLNSTGRPAVILGAAVFAVIFGSPIVVRWLDAGPRALDREVGEGVERVERTLAGLDVNLSAISALRDRLVAAGVDFKSQPPPSSGDEPAGGGPRTDRLIAASERNSKGLLGAAPAAQPPQLAELIQSNEQIVQTAEAQLKRLFDLKSGDVSAANNLWANRAAALTALAKGRVSRDRAWLDRQDAAALRTVAYEQMLEALDLKRRAAAAAERSPAKAIEAGTALRAGLEQAAGAAGTALAELESQVQERRTRIAALREAASAADASATRLQASPSGDFRSLRAQVERFSEQSRLAEYEADQLEFGAMKGGTFVPDDTGDLLAGSYEGAEPAPGLVEMEARRAALQQTVDKLRSALSESDAELQALNATAAEIDSQRQALTSAAEARIAAVQATLKQITERTEAAEKAEQAAIEAYLRGSASITKIQTAARKRKEEASKLAQESGERKSERLQFIITDQDTPAANETLGATLCWSAAEVYLQAILGQEATSRLLAFAAPLGIETPDEPADKLATWRTAAADRLAEAARHLKTAKDLLASASYDNVAGQRVSGSNYRWQVSQLEGAVQMLAAVLADSPDTADAARVQARALLQEALQGREASPLLANAAAALESLCSESDSGAEPSSAPAN